MGGVPAGGGAGYTGYGGAAGSARCAPPYRENRHFCPYCTTTFRLLDAGAIPEHTRFTSGPAGAGIGEPAATEPCPGSGKTPLGEAEPLPKRSPGRVAYAAFQGCLEGAYVEWEGLDARTRNAWEAAARAVPESGGQA